MESRFSRTHVFFNTFYNDSCPLSCLRTLVLPPNPFQPYMYKLSISLSPFLLRGSYHFTFNTTAVPPPCYPSTTQPLIPHPPGIADTYYHSLPSSWCPKDKRTKVILPHVTYTCVPALTLFSPLDNDTASHLYLSQPPANFSYPVHSSPFIWAHQRKDGLR